MTPSVLKTWFNERYVKDTSKKIKRAIGARQKEGTLITRPPFGYRRNAEDKMILEIVPKEAEYIRKFTIYTFPVLVIEKSPLI